MRIRGEEGLADEDGDEEERRVYVLHPNCAVEDV